MIVNTNKDGWVGGREYIEEAKNYQEKKSFIQSIQTTTGKVTDTSRHLELFVGKTTQAETSIENSFQCKILTGFKTNEYVNRGNWILKYKVSNILKNTLHEEIIHHILGRQNNIL